MTQRRLGCLLMTAVTAFGGLVLAGCAPRNSFTTRQKEAVLRTDLQTMRDCLAQFYGDKGRYPAALAELVVAGYLHKVPFDPMTARTDTWVEVTALAGTANGRASGVIDVRSGSLGRASDGRPYNEW